MKILAIDNQNLILRSVEKKLKGLAYKVQTADCGKMGEELFDSYQPDLVLLDINLPDMSGLEVVKYIRYEQNSKTPILVMTESTDIDTIMEGYTLGIDDYLKKPVSLDEMVARIKCII